MVPEHNNALLRPFDGPFGSVPFNKIKQEDYGPAIEALIVTAREAIDKIAADPTAPDFDNVIVALESAGRQLGRATEAFFNLSSAETNDYLEKVQEKVSPLLAAHANDITLNAALFERIRQVHDARPALGKEEARLLDKTYKSFVRNGALLDAAGKEKLRAIDGELAALQVKFSQNLLQETNDYVLNVKEEARLAGLPESIKAQALAEAEGRGLEGWAFTLQYPSWVPFMTYAADRDLRQEMYLANGHKAYRDNACNNEPVLQKIVALRQDRARLLGFADHATFVLEERMAHSPEAVRSFLEDLLEKARPHAHKEVEGLMELAKGEGVDALMPYDHAYYAEKMRQARFDLSEEALKPYFPLGQVLAAAFGAAARLFGIAFVERDDVPVYHEEVKVYEVLESGRHKALLYTDWHPRKGKRSGAWMTSFQDQYKDEMGDHRPHVSLVCNFSRPIGDRPSLLTFSEVTTLFHELGHGLHAIMADTRFESLSGTHVYWDFVELPSQFMENYCYEKEFLSLFARHYATGEALPEAQIDKIVASANFMEGYQTLRQLSFATLDMAYHTHQWTEGPMEDFEKKITEPMRLYPLVAGVAQSPSFAHIFSGGYAAGYYSYKWSEVLDADAFGLFKERGIFDSEVAGRWRVLLSKGGTEDPMDLYVAFRGRKPNADALLKRAGLVP